MNIPSSLCAADIENVNVLQETRAHRAEWWRFAVNSYMDTVPYACFVALGSVFGLMLLGVYLSADESAVDLLLSNGVAVLMYSVVTAMAAAVPYVLATQPRYPTEQRTRNMRHMQVLFKGYEREAEEQDEAAPQEEVRPAAAAERRDVSWEAQSEVNHIRYSAQA